MRPGRKTPPYTINRLRRISEAQEIVLRETASGRTIKYVHEKIIYPRFYISYGTLIRWLGVPAKRLLNNYEQNNNDN